MSYKFKYPSKIDYSLFAENRINLEVKYGLPSEVKFCKGCVISNQRPNSCQEFKHDINTKKQTIHFDEECECDACKAARQKHGVIDWGEREKELIDLCNKFRKKDGSYDCLVPGSGGKDSFYAAHILKYKYNMHPLTVTWAPHMYTPWGQKNYQSWVHAGFDNYLCTPNGKIHRLLTRLAIENLLHPFQPFILGQKQLAAKMAVIFNIPLVFYGENEAEYGNPIADNSTSLRSQSYFSAEEKERISLSGVPYNELVEDYKINPCDLEIYLPESPEKIEKKKIEVHYLGYYLKWHPKGAFNYAVENGGFIPSPERTAGTYSNYNSIDDRIDDFHYYTTYIKFGIGRASYDAAQEIRNGEIDRKEGIALVKKYDGEFPARFEEDIYRYLSMDEMHFPQISKFFEQPIMDRAYFNALTDTFRSPHLWKYVNQKWMLRHTIWND